MALFLRSLAVLAATSLALSQQLFTFTGGPGYELNVGDAGQDVDRDGLPDLLLTAPRAGDLGVWEGGVLVRSGADGSLIHGLGTSVPNGYGRSGALLGDLDGDGRSEFAVGAWLDDSAGDDAGRLFVHSGLDASVLAVLDGSQPDATLGSSVVAAGDVDGDGIPDLLVGAPGVDGVAASSGQALLVSGADFSVLRVYEGDFFLARLGTVMAQVGDVDGDGVPDHAFGLVSDPVAGSFSGSVRVHSGADGSLLHRFDGEAPNDQVGLAVAGAGDLDGDGHADVILGAPGNDEGGTDSGRVRVHSGLDGRVLLELRGYGVGDRMGSAVAGLGDVDGDGVDDVALGSEFVSVMGPVTGQVRVHSGADGSLLRLWHGFQSQARYGSRVRATGDLDGDGRSELAVGQPFLDLFAFGDEGRVQVYSFAAQDPPTYCFTSPGICPCGNDGGEGGCVNSTGSGARLLATGSPSLAADDLVLAVLDLPPSTFGVVFVGDVSTSVPFGDGLLCAGQPVQRFPVESAGASGAFGTGPGLPPGIDLGGIPTSYFQAWYRDPAGPCGTGTNLSNGVAVTWIP